MSEPPRPVASAAILSEGYAGLENQGLGLAEAAGWSTRLCRIAPRGLWERLPARIWPRPLAAVVGLDVAPGEIVVSTGGTAGVVGAALRRAGRARAVVQVQNPRIELGAFDVVIANRHDRISGPNVIVTRTALHRVTAARLAQARQDWGDRLRPADGRPLVAVLVGGSNGRFRLGRDEAGRLAGGLDAMCRRDRVAIALTPSRRTAPDAVVVLRDALAPHRGFVWDGAGANPYLGLLACADAIVVTCDSISMVSEAVATAAPVHVATLPGRSRRIGLFLDDLRRDGRIRTFDGRFDPFPASPIDDTAEAAYDTRRRLGDRREIGPDRGGGRVPAE